MNKQTTNNEKYFVKTLLQSGCAVTQQRLLILSFLHSQKDPVSIKTVIHNIDSRKINRATIYRILKLFCKKDVINQIDMKDDATYYELKDSNDHHHIICVECKKVEDFKGCYYENLIKKIKKQNKEFAKITNHSFELFGVCKSCI